MCDGRIAATIGGCGLYVAVVVIVVSLASVICIISAMIAVGAL